MKGKYENFEKTLFNKKFQETKYVIKDTALLVQKIQTQQDKLTSEAAKAREGLEMVTPQNQDQRAKLRKIFTDIQQVEKRVEASVKVLEAESKEFEHLEQNHQKCDEILAYAAQLASPDLAAMVN